MESIGENHAKHTCALLNPRTHPRPRLRQPAPKKANRFNFDIYERSRAHSINQNIRLVAALLPASLTRNGEFTIKSATVHSCIDQIIFNRHVSMYSGDTSSSHMLARVGFAFCAPQAATPMNVECALEFVDRNRLVFHCKQMAGAPGMTDTYEAHWHVGVCSDLREFEANFARTVRNATIDWLPAIGKTPDWCYILLAMLVYGDDLRPRTECVGATVFERLRPFFGGHVVIGADDAPYPFLSRLRCTPVHAGALAIVPYIK